MQKTDFPFEISIGENCGTDNIRQIVLAYQAKYPDTIRVLLSEQNMSGAQNIMLIQQACRGKYGAMCEGADQVMVLPTGSTVSEQDTEVICNILGEAIANATLIHRQCAR